MSEVFKVLSDREHCINRPGVYIGSIVEEPISGIVDYQYQTKNVVPGLLKIIEEALNNCVDEHIRTQGEFAKNISISIGDTKNGTEVIISDDGRGIPVEKIGETYRPVLAWTELRAGSNFDDSKGRITAGTNGMGISLTNIFSTSFVGITDDGKKRLTLTCSDNMANRDFKVGKTSKRGTTVKFIPDLKRFGIEVFTQDHTDMLRERLNNLAICFPAIKFTFNEEHIVVGGRTGLAAKFSPHAFSHQTDNVVYVVAPSGVDEEFRHISYVNGIWMKNGGAHVDQFTSSITSEMIPLIKKKWKIDVPANQIKQHLLVGMWVRDFPNPRFDSQTKERLTNTAAEVRQFFDFDPVAVKVAKHIISTPEFVDKIIAAILYKKEQADRAALAKALKQNKKMRVINHISAQSDNPAERTLIITEGLSSIGLLLRVRDPVKTGGYPLKGKPLNVRGMKPSEIMKNKEISELMSIIGLEFNKPADSLNYERILILSDADTDGAAILCLMINFFSMWPELFENKRVFRCESPLYICTKGKNSKWFYSQEDYEAFDSTGHTVQYFKGLGGLSEEQYAEVINNPKLLQISMNDNTDIRHLMMAFGDDSQGRKNWLQQ